MKILYHKSFTKSFKKLPRQLKVKAKETIATFARDPFTKQLKNHPLKGKMKGLRAISVTGDIRIIFEERNGYTVVLMLDVGTHNQVY
jgi:addiction module RelE/StbE family toxin